MAYAVRGRSSSLLAPSVYRGARDRRAIALTFDDGPSESTPALLEILQRHRAPATFFQCGANVRRLPSIAREVAAAGHEIGNHTDTHPRLDFKSSEFIYDELARGPGIHRGGDAAFAPCCFGRPIGVRWFGLRSAQRQFGLLGVMWTTIGVDWKWPEERVDCPAVSGALKTVRFCACMTDVN